jgi:protoporphyrinogen IX oxidase
MIYLWIKALHVVFVIAWFAGLFYLPRLFVYHADTTDSLGETRFKLMEKRLFALMTLAGLVAATMGLALLALQPNWLGQGWLQTKLLLVIGLVSYHVWCGRLVGRFRNGRNQRTARWYRWFNEIPTLFLFLIVLLVIVKPF